MGTIANAFNQALRDYATDGVQGSGLHEPLKSELRALASTIETAIGNGALAGMVDVKYATAAELAADLAWDAGSVGLVYADSADSNNDIHIKIGASGSGNWQLTSIVRDVIGGAANPWVELAEAWAEGTLPGGAGTKSAKEHATDAAASAAAAAVSDASSAANAAAADLSETAAELAADAAADLVSPANIFVGGTLGDAESAVSEGTYFKWIDTASGLEYTRLRTAGGSDLISTSATSAALASTNPGKGASLIGIEDGDTVQGRFDRMKADTLANMAASNVEDGDVIALFDETRPGLFQAQLAADLDATALAADTAKGIYNPSTADAAYVWVRQIEWIKPEFFGDISDPATAHVAMDLWANQCSVDKYAGRVDRPYRFKQGVWLPDNTLIEMTADGWLHNVRTSGDGGNAQEMGALQIGRMHPVWLPFSTGTDGGTGSWTAAFEWDDLNDIAGGFDCQFDTNSDMDDYTDGQVVLVASGAYISYAAAATPGKSWSPHTLVATVMIKGTSGQWRSLYPLPAMADPKVTNLSTATTDWDSRTPSIARNVGIYGGKVSSDEGNPFQKTGMLGCDIHLAETDGVCFLANNCMNFSKIEVDRAHASEFFIEIACGSHATDVIVNSGTAQDNGSATKCVRIGECSTDVRVTLHDTHLQGRTGSAANDVLRINEGRRCSIRWESGRLTGNWLALMKCNDNPATDSGDANAKVALCDQNRIHVGEQVDCSNGAVTRVIWDASSYDYAADSLNATRDNRYSGAPNVAASGDAARLDSYRAKLGDGRPFKFTGTDVNLNAGSDGGHELDIEGSFTWTSHDRTKIAKLRINGMDQLAAPQSTSAPTDASVAYTVDFQYQHLKVSLADAGTTAFDFTAVSNFIGGGRLWVEIDNTTGASITPTVTSSIFKLASGVTMPAVPDDDVLLVEMIGLKNSVGNNRVLILSAAVAG